MADYLMGLDFGTGGAKGCIIDISGTVLGFSYEELPLIHEHAGWSEHDSGRYWPAACRIIQTCLAQSHVKPQEIRGVAISSALPSLVMVDKAHRPLERAYNLMDRRAIGEVEWLKANIGEERLFQTSGYRVEDHPALVNLLWEKRNRPDSFQRVHKALTIDGYITLKLTGKPTLHYSAAAFYGVAYNVRERRFDEEMLEEIGISPALLPDLHDCDEIVGEVTREAAEATGLAAGTKVAAGQVDCNASWLGAGAVEVGDFQSNLGTVGNFGIIHKDLDYMFSDIGRIMMSFPYTVDSSSTYVTVPTTITGGQTIRYLRDNFSKIEVETERILGVSSYDLLNFEAEKVPLGCDGLIVLPFLMGERTPIWDSFARGVVFGLSLNHTKGHLVRAMMEAVAFAMYDSYRLVREAGLKVNLPMVLNEGGAVSRLWRQIITDVFDVPIVLAGRRTGAPFGDALLAGVASGVLPDYSVSREWFHGIERMEPDASRHGRYMEIFALYKKLYEHLKQDFRDLAELRDRLSAK